MKRHPYGRSIVVDFALKGFAVLLLVGFTMFGLLTRSFSRVLEAQLLNDAARTSQGLAAALELHIWNMDDTAISEYVRQYAAWPGLVKFRVTSEFGDVICEASTGVADNPLEFEREVFRDGRHIGTIELGLSREGIKLVQRAIAYSCLLVLVGGSVVILLVMLLAQRLVVGRALGSMLDGIQGIADGKYAHRLPNARHREFNALIGQINRMAGQIEERTKTLVDEIRSRKMAEEALLRGKESLEEEVARRTGDVVKMNVHLQQEIADRRKAEAEMLLISGREQQRMGRDLHDSLGQQLVGISFLSKSLEAQLRELSPRDAELAAQISGFLQDAVSQSRQLAHGLYPVGMLEGGIREGLSMLADNVSTLFGVTCTVECEKSIALDSDRATHIYRIAQEAVNNARRHGKARDIHIALCREGDNCKLTIIDDGCGMRDATASSDGIGIRIMRYRAEAIQGSFDIRLASETTGTRVAVVFPLRAAKLERNSPDASDD